MQKTLDLSIKKLLTGTLEGGYVSGNGRTYQSYMNNDVWETFKNNIKNNYRDAFSEYGAGQGGEMNDNGKIPPKMASYGSSSRMIFCLCKDIANYHFEKKLPTKVGGTANLDGFIEKDDEVIFTEAKCREPYGEKPHLIESKYGDLYRYIDKDSECNLGVKIEDASPKMKVTFKAGDLVISNFDIKQMICHLLGIAVKFLETPADKKITFLYLCYNPKLIDITDKKKEKEIFSVYDRMCNECMAIDFKKLFKTIVVYLCKELRIGNESDIEKMVDKFSFCLCDQENYTGHLV